MSSSLQNLEAYDPFADAGDSEDVGDYIHVRIQQRNGRKSLTTVAGLDTKLDFKKILKVFKKEFCCNGTIVEDEEVGNVLQLQGDQRKKIAQFFIAQGICTKKQIKVHGF